MATKKVTICDSCGSEQNIEKYRIGTATGSLYSMELCDSENCAGPVRDLIVRHQKTSRRATFKPSAVDKVVVTKRTPRKTANKRVAPSMSPTPEFQG